MDLIYATWVGFYHQRKWTFDPADVSEEDPQTKNGVAQLIRDRIGRRGNILATVIQPDHEVIITLHLEDGDPVMIGWMAITDEESYWHTKREPFDDIAAVVVPWMRQHHRAFNAKLPRRK